MADFLKTDDVKTLTQKVKNMVIRAEVLNDNYQIINRIEGAVISGNYSVSADSDVRRTCSIDIALDRCNMNFNEHIYFNCYMRIYVGYYSYAAKDTLYYNIGIYCFDSNNITYDGTTNTLSLSLSDQMVMMDSDHKGTMYGALTPAIYACDPDTGYRYGSGQLAASKDHSIVLKDIITGLITDFGVKNYIIDDVGNYYHTNADSITWNELPYDLEFSAGCGLNEILDEIKDLYGFYEMYYDIDGVFHFQMLPTLESDMCVLDESVVNDLVISENLSENIYDVKNVIEVWGADLEADRFAQNSDDETLVTYGVESSEGIYSVTLESFEEDSYTDGLLVGIKVPESNVAFSHGKNLLLRDTTCVFANGITGEYNSDGTVTLNGTDTTTNNNYVQYTWTDKLYIEDSFLETGEKYILTSSPDGAALDTYFTIFRIHKTNETISNYFEIGTGNTFTIPSDADYIQVIISIRVGQPLNDVTFSPMIRVATDTDATYKPYSLSTTSSYYININKLGKKRIWKTIVSSDSEGNEDLDPGQLTKDTVYVFKYRTSINGFYLLGTYQVHALAVLTNGDMKPGLYTNEAQRLKYFQDKYNVTKVKIEVDETSPYSIERIGKIHHIPDDSTYENLDSDDSALSAAEYVLWQKARRTDTISLNMILVPWLDVNQKIKYIRQGETEAEQYIVKSISADLTGGTMSVEMMKFYNYYNS